MNGLRNWSWIGVAALSSIVLLAATGCTGSSIPAASPGQLTPPVNELPISTSTLPGPTVTSRLSSTPSATPTSVASPSQNPTVSPTPNPYQPYTIEALRGRTYGGGRLDVYERWRSNSEFERAYFEYPSDGLQVHGFMDIPTGPGKHPVVIVLHGYVDPSVYRMQPYTTRYADGLAEAGYFVLHPNYRSYPPSDLGPNPFRAGFAIDVLNLLAIVREQAGDQGPLGAADGSRIGLLGHSMGGGIAIRTMVVDHDIDAVVLYGSMSADETRNYQRILDWSGGRAGWEELNVSGELLAQISPINYLLDLESAVSIHHGEDDPVVPPSWSEDLCRLLTSLGKDTECFSYPEQPHTFIEDGEAQLLERVLEFFGRELAEG